MKNFTLFVAAAALATSAFAQMPQQREAISLKNHSAQQLMHKQADKKHAPQQASKNLVSHFTKPAKAASFDIITEAQGETKLYSRTGFAWANTLFGVSLTDQTGMAAELVYAEDGKTVYLKDPISNLSAGTYAVGTLNEDGTQLTVDLEQMLVYFEEDGYGMKLAMLDLIVDEEGNAYYYKDETATQAVFNIVDGAYELQDTDNEFGYESVVLPSRIFGAVYEDIDPDYDEQWAGYGDLHTILSEATVEPVVAPEGLELNDLLLSYAADTEGARDARIVKGGIVDDVLYIKGVNDEDPEMFMKGIIEGDKIRIPDHQYVGLAMNMFTYTINSKAEMMYDEYYEEWYVGFEPTGEDLILNYDAETQTITYANEEEAFVVNYGDQEIYYMYAFLMPQLEAYVEMPGVPQDPEIWAFQDAVAESGEGVMQSTIPLFTVDGYYMNPEKVAYRIYIKIGDEVELYPLFTDEYMLLEEDMYEIPYNFSDGWDIERGASYVYFYQTGFDLMGLQSINRNGGESWQSNISWCDGTFEEANGVDGIKEVNAAAHRVEVYDVMGRKANGQKGILIIRKGAEITKAFMK